jgi:succinate dehydrogenase / fumarate reductase membrane anchor subunit
MTDMRTPLKTIRGFGSAKSGTAHFWRQRVTAIANIPLLIAFFAIIIALAGEPLPVVASALGHPVISIVMILAIISICYHMYLGMQTVIEDYVHDEGRKLATLIANLFFCLAVALISIFALLRIGLLVAIQVNV